MWIPFKESFTGIVCKYSIWTAKCIYVSLSFNQWWIRLSPKGRIVSDFQPVQTPNYYCYNYNHTIINQTFSDVYSFCGKENKHHSKRAS